MQVTNAGLLVLALGGMACVEEDLPYLPGGDVISTETDPLNCGAKGHDCFGGACVSGQCQPVLLASEQAGASAFLLNDGYLYWGMDDPARIKRIAISGGDVQTLSTSTYARPYAMVADATNLYWTVRPVDHSVRKMPKAGGDLTVLATGQQAPSGIAVDGSSVYWASYVAGEIRSVPINGGTVTTVATNLTRPANLSVGPGRLIWTEENASGVDSSGTVKTLGLTGEIVTLASNQNQPDFAITDGEFAWWTTDRDPALADGGTVARTRIAGGPIEPLVWGLTHPVAISRFGDHLYWAEQNTIQSTPTEGGDLTVVFQSAVAFTGWTQDDTSSYWLEPDTGLIKRLAKPL